MNTILLPSLIGQTLTNVERIRDRWGQDSIVFTRDDGKICTMLHTQDCCEDVRIEDICGDLQALVGTPILMAEEAISRNETPGGTKPPDDDFLWSYTWTFYKFATIKGYVTIRWYGTSNGYYSERVTLSDWFNPQGTNAN
jgi:hypothetical protein